MSSIEETQPQNSAEAFKIFVDSLPLDEKSKFLSALCQTDDSIPDYKKFLNAINSTCYEELSNFVEKITKLAFIHGYKGQRGITFEDNSDCIANNNKIIVKPYYPANYYAFSLWDN